MIWGGILIDSQFFGWEGLVYFFFHTIKQRIFFVLSPQGDVFSRLYCDLVEFCGGWWEFGGWKQTG